MDPTIFSQLRTQREALRHVEAENPKKKHESGDLLSCDDDLNPEEAVKRYESFFQSGCSNWYKELENITFSSTFCRLTRVEAKVIVGHYEDSLHGGTKKEGLAAAKSSLAHLEKRLARILKVEMAKSSVNLAFIKLNTRSPKDSPKALAKAKEAYTRRIQADFDEYPSPNERWKILGEEATKSLAVSSAQDALNLLLDSERVYEDLKFALDTPTGLLSQEEEEEESPDVAPNTTPDAVFEDIEKLTRVWPVCLVARAWDPRLKPASEFRGTCWEGKLTTLNQYYHSFYFQEIEECKDAIQKDILDCMQRPDLKAAISRLGGHCIVDFCWLGPGDVIVIELNPFDGKYYGTLQGSTGLFSWDNPKDRAVIQGESSFEFRVRKEPEETRKLKHQTHPDWRNIIFPPKFETDCAGTIIRG